MMGAFVPITVETYSGYKADETPRAFFHQGRRYLIEEVIDRWYQASADPTLASASYFKVRTTDGAVFIIKRDNESQTWSLQHGGRLA
jgi:hypothetical protein